MDYDVLILGGGIIGCAAAYELSKYNINIALIEKDYDVADDISLFNTAVIYDGSETSDSIMANLENIGRKLIELDCKKFNIPYRKIGALRVSSNEVESIQLDVMLNRAKERGLQGVCLLENDEIYSMEPNLNLNVKKALYSKNVAVISPYDLAISYAEVASDNGVNFKVEEEVINIKNISKGFNVTTNKNKFTCKFVINTIPDEIYDNGNEIIGNRIKAKKMNYIMFNDKNENVMSTIVINDTGRDSFAINIPVQYNRNLIGIKGYDNLTLDESVNLSKSILGDIRKEDIISVFSESYSKDSICIDDSNINNGYIKITGSHYGKITIAPAIAKMIEETLKKNMNIIQKKDFVDKKRDLYVFRNMSNEQRNEIIALDERYGNIICSCNNISEGEIVDCIRRPLGARTLEGIKRRTGVGFGSCNGAYCNIKIMKILAREMNNNPLNIVKDSMQSRILASKIKEFNEI